MALDTRSSRLRMSILGAVAVALFASLFARVWFLQVVSEQEFSQQAVDNRVREIIEQAPRGRILDVKGRILVDNRPSIVVTIDKETLLQAGLTEAERDELFLRLATEISASGRLTKVADIVAAFESNRYGPFAEVPVVRDISEELQVYLAEHAQDFPGVNTDVVTVREYPYGSLAAHILGYVGPLNDAELAAVEGKEKTYQPNDEIGKGGVEAFFEDQLRGTPGRRVVEVDKFNNILEVREEIAPQAGKRSAPDDRHRRAGARRTRAACWSRTCPGAAREVRRPRDHRVHRPCRGDGAHGPPRRRRAGHGVLSHL